MDWVFPLMEPAFRDQWAASKTKRKFKKYGQKYTITCPPFVQTGLADLKAVARGADMHNDILQKVTNMWFLLQLLRNFCEPLVWLPACPLAGETRHWPLDQRFSSHVQVTGWSPRPASPQLIPKTFCSIDGGLESKSSQCFLWWAFSHWSRTHQRD